MLLGKIKRGGVGVGIHDGEIEMGVGVVRIDSEALTEGFFRLSGFAFLPESDCEVIMGDGILGVGRDDAIENGDRVVEAALATLDISKINRSEDVVGFKG